MPAIVVVILRFLVQQIVLTGLTTGGAWLLNQAIKATMKAFGATEEQANAVVGNAILQTAEFLGISVLLLTSKLPQNVSKKLGLLTNKGKAVPSIAGERPIKPSFGMGPKMTAIEVSQGTETVIQAIMTKTGKTLGVIKGAASWLSTVLGLGFVPTMMLLNAMDHGGFNSAYSNFMQKVLSMLGVEPNQQYAKSKVLTGDMFTRVYGAFQEQNPVGINDPRTGETLPFNRENFVEVADKIGSDIVMATGVVTYKQMIGSMIALMVWKDGKMGSVGTSSPAGAGGVGVSTTGVRVFTGLVSQGTLGAGLSFIARPDDLIQSESELQDAAQNNLAAYLAALPGKVVYEIKIVSSVTTKDGFRQVGTSQQIVSGYTQDSKPRYRTVINKFAVLNLYILTDKGSKSKLTSIVLGPTDAVKFQPTTDTLINLEKSIQKSVFTTDLNEITGVKSDNAIQTSTRSDLYEVKAAGLPAGFLAPKGEPVFTGGTSKLGGGLVQSFVWDNKPYTFEIKAGEMPPGSIPDAYMKRRAIEAVALARGVEVSDIVTPDNFAKMIGVEESRINKDTGEIIDPTDAEVARFNAVFTTTAPASSNNDPKTLSEYYAAKGLPLPSVASRSQIYQAKGLGQAAYYTGTAEQNTKLLSALKGATETMARGGALA